MSKQWLLKPPTDRIAEAARAWNVPSLVARVMLGRGHQIQVPAEGLLDPAMSDLISPDKLPGVEAACDRIQIAFQTQA